MPSDGSNSMRAKLWWHLLRQAAEVRNGSGEKDELTLWRTAPSELHGSKVQGTTRQTYRSQQQHGQAPGSAVPCSASLAQHKCSQHNISQGQGLSCHKINKLARSPGINLHPAREYERMKRHEHIGFYLFTIRAADEIIHTAPLGSGWCQHM